MKFTILATFGLIAGAAAQWPDLPQCERTCRDNMVGSEKSTELGCSAGDLACLCTKQDFIYGLRDCSRAICNGDQAAELLDTGLRVCRDAGVEITTNGGGQVTTANGSGGATVSTIYSTLVSDGSTITTAVGTTTLGQSGASGSSAASGSGQSGQVIVETITQSDGDVVRSTLTTIGVTEATGSSEASETGSATETGTEASGTATGDETATTATGTEATGSAASGTATTTTTTSGNAGTPQMTAHPVGMLAAAGLAVLIL